LLYNIRPPAGLEGPAGGGHFRITI